MENKDITLSANSFISPDLSLSKERICELEQPVTDEQFMPFLLMDDADDSSHGTFETLGEARGAVLYDHLTAWTIYRSGQIVDSHSPSEPAPRLILGLDDCFAAIEDRGGKVDAFAVDGETHFEVTVNGHGYGPMVETELFWFVKGLIER